MKVIKPNKVSVLTRCFEHQRRYMLGVSALLFVPLGGGESEQAGPDSSGAWRSGGPPAVDPPLLSEVSMWSFVAERMGKEAVLDVGMPKCRGEYLIHGRAYAPGGVAAPAVPVRAIVDDLQKSLYVRGDRYWQTNRHASEARPFTELPIHYSLAYGGEGYAKNPLGRGFGETELFGQTVRMLPNIELPEQQVQSARAQPEPAGFGPIDLSWPQRQALAGSYDQAWLETLFPGFPPDLDWGFFSIAPRDQQREAFWQGGEPYRFDNLHPQRPALMGYLPRYRARAFIARGVRRKRSDETETADQLAAGLDEVGLHLQTLWFYPDAERAVLIFHGSIPVATDDATDVRYLLLAAESPGQDRDLRHYAEVLATRLDRKQGPYAALREHELLPPGQTGLLDDPGLAAGIELRKSDNLMEANLFRRAERQHAEQIAALTALGVPPELFPEAPTAPEEPPSLAELPDVIEKLLADAEAQKVEHEAQVAAKQVEVDAHLRELGIDPDEIHAQQDAPSTGPPTFTADSQRAAVAATIANCKAQGVDAQALEDILADPQTQANWESAETQVRVAYRHSAHLQDPAAPLGDERSAQARVAVEQALRAGEDFSTLNLTGADLSGMSLRGAKFAGAFFESVNFEGADLTGADLSDAVLAHARLAGATFDEANLSGANLGRAQLQGASLAQATLERTILFGADLTGASIRGATLTSVDLIEATLTELDAREIETSKLALIELPCKGLQLGGAKLDRCAFVKLELDGADFSGADLSRCAFVSCKAEQVSFVGATLEKACFVEWCELDGASFTEAQATTCNFRGSFMRGCDLSKATLDRADLCECQLEGARFYQAVARETRFDKANLTDAVLLSANLMRASFMGATIYGADLRATNLYGADMARVRSNPAVQLDEANLTKVRIHPTHIEQPDQPEPPDQPDGGSAQ